MKRHCSIRSVSDKRRAKAGGKVYSTFSAPAKPIARTAMVRHPRPKAETERAHGPAEFRAWTKEQPCAVRSCRRVPCDAAHVKSGGTGRKDDWTRVVPLCSTIVATGYSGHHDEYDGAKRSFAKQYDLDMLAEAAAHHANWQQHCAGRES